MWTNLLLGLVFQIGMTWSLFMDPPDLGVSIDVTKGFLFNDFNMRVIHNPDVDDKYTYPEWAHQIFRNDFEKVSNSFNPTEVNGTFRIDICGNVEQLLMAYFRDISVDGVPSSWEIFARHWFDDKISRKGKIMDIKYIAKAISKRFGIPTKYISNDYAYVLIKTSVIQHEAAISLPLSNLKFIDTVEGFVEKMYSGVPDSYNYFFRRYGTHFPSSYATGGVLYQVFVYNAEDSKKLDESFTSGLGLKDEIEDLTQKQKLYLSPNFALHIGNILSADSNKTIEKWAEETCTKITDTPYKHSYPNLLELRDNLTVFKEYRSIIQNNAVITLRMSSNVKAILKLKKDFVSSDFNKYHRREL